MAMPKQSLQEKLARLKRMEEGPLADADVREIRQALGAGGVLTTRAIRVVSRQGLRDFAIELCAAFHRGLQNPAKSDPGCNMKLAAIEALNALDYSEPDIYLAGIHHIQLEFSFGSPVDTADTLRAACAFGLYRMGYAALLCELVSLLVDPQTAPRRAAIKILTEMDRESSEMLLRLKALHGDREPEVMGDCFNGLMAIAPSRSPRFVEQFFSNDSPEIVEEAAIAIGNSRRPEAFARLRGFRESSVRPGFKRMLLLPIALTRCEEAFALLLAVLKDECSDHAAAAIQALAIYSDSPERRERIREAVSIRNDPDISTAYEKEIARVHS
jgi:HEAT repeat protein